MSSNRKCVKLIQLLRPRNCPSISRSTTQISIYGWIFRTCRPRRFTKFSSAISFKLNCLRSAKDVNKLRQLLQPTVNTLNFPLKHVYFSPEIYNKCALLIVNNHCVELKAIGKSLCSVITFSATMLGTA